MPIVATLSTQTATIGGATVSLEFQISPRSMSAGTKSISRSTMIGHDNASTSAHRTSGAFQRAGHPHDARAPRGSMAPHSAAIQMA